MGDYCAEPAKYRTACMTRGPPTPHTLRSAHAWAWTKPPGSRRPELIVFPQCAPSPHPNPNYYHRAPPTNRRRKQPGGNRSVMAAAKIAPSMLSSDFANLASEAERMLRLGADWLHMDIMVRSRIPFHSPAIPVPHGCFGTCHRSEQ